MHRHPQQHARRQIKIYHSMSYDFFRGAALAVLFRYPDFGQAWAVDVSCPWTPLPRRRGVSRPSPARAGVSRRFPAPAGISRPSPAVAGHDARGFGFGRSIPEIRRRSVAPVIAAMPGRHGRHEGAGKCRNARRGPPWLTAPDCRWRDRGRRCPGGSSRLVAPSPRRHWTDRASALEARHPVS